MDFFLPVSPGRGRTLAKIGMMKREAIRRRRGGGPNGGAKRDQRDCPDGEQCRMRKPRQKPGHP